MRHKHYFAYISISMQKDFFFLEKETFVSNARLLQIALKSANFRHQTLLELTSRQNQLQVDGPVLPLNSWATSDWIATTSILLSNTPLALNNCKSWKQTTDLLWTLFVSVGLCLLEGVSRKWQHESIPWLCGMLV